jgi:hypothetical protein
MSKIAESKSLAELQQQDTVKGADLLATVRDYANTGAAISSSTLKEILEKNPNIELRVLADCLESCLKGAGDQLNRRFPEDAGKWARFAYECADRVVSSQYGSVILVAQENASRENVQATTVQAALSAVDFHRHNEDKTKQALETGHLLKLLENRLYPAQSLSDLSVPATR